MMRMAEEGTVAMCFCQSPRLVISVTVDMVEAGYRRPWEEAGKLSGEGRVVFRSADVLAVSYRRRLLKSSGYLRFWFGFSWAS